MQHSDIPAALNAALTHHQQGHLREAAALYQAILQIAPQHADTLHLFGVLMHQSGQDGTAKHLIGTAIEIDPKRVEYHGNLGRVLHSAGETADAEKAYRDALALDPEFVDGLSNLGGLLLEKSEVEDALALLHKAVELAPEHGNAVMNLGNALRADGAMAAAEAAHQRAAALLPDSERAHLNLATTLLDLNKLEAADRALKRSLLLAPALVESLNNLAYLQINFPDFVTARRWFERAIAVEPLYAAPRSGIAECAYYQLDMETCLEHSRIAVELAPHDPQIRSRHALRLLATGRLGEGWDEREWRLKRADRVRRIGLPPLWEGEDLKGRRILVCAEEGVGDEILYAGLVSELLADGASVVLECDERLVPVFRRSFPSVLVHPYARAGDRFKPVQHYEWLPKDSPVDFAIDGGSLPKFLRRTLADFDRQQPYLSPDPVRTARLAERLAALPQGPRVGFAWRSKNTGAYRNIHYTELPAWRRMLTDPDLQIISMQYGRGWQAEIDNARATFGARITVLDDLDLTDDFDDILALASAVDVAVCPSSTLGWVGGALGKPTFVFHPVPLFVRYGTDGFPGFPSMRSFPKTVDGPWSGPVDAIHAALRAFGT
ncbi:tetratricopeptide repeat protein [Nisaea acidiphila]|uniref:Tetratricopeptide repeat protein n=1 Tax=Nisaea acidiphila TaxID=1862145 RepID=A0A9J7AUM6_9PROT|nr:tetratricopeptide repeat protein [Nisaea acidiphila]UUX51435.1 tetratricopeptide repeat protein [Nisaea acidiphila]